VIAANGKIITTQLAPNVLQSQTLEGGSPISGPPYAIARRPAPGSIAMAQTPHNGCYAKSLRFPK
jgi:hypothetical protein